MKKIARAGTLAMVVALSGCATTNNPNDPLEGYNRAMFSFNDTADQAVIKPVAQAYQFVFPEFVQTGIGNFFGNIGDMWSAVNQLLQGRVEVGVSTIMRVAINTTFGLGGVLDVSTEARLPKEKSDFGQTLGKWGVGAGPYVVLPLFGPSTLRDTVALPAEVYGDLWSYKYPVRWRNTGTGLRLIDKRAQLLNATNLMEDAALDKYDFVRDTYLQARKAKIDGNDADRQPAKEEAEKP